MCTSTILTCLLFYLCEKTLEMVDIFFRPGAELYSYPRQIFRGVLSGWLIEVIICSVAVLSTRQHQSLVR